MLNIAVLGYYGFGNAGDEAILDNLRHFLAPHTVVPIPLGLSDSDDTVARLNAFDFVILGGGGLYRQEPPSPFGTFDRWGQKLTVPLGVLGLGLSRLAPRFRDATRELVERSHFFLVRDEVSRQLLAHPEVALAPDLTFYRPLAPSPARPQQDQVVCGVNLRPAHRGSERWLEAVQKLDGRKVALPFSVHPTLGDREALLGLDPNCPTELRPDTLAELDIVIGTAFHAVVFAVQMGIPVIALNYDPKVERFMREVELDDYLLNWDETHCLPAAYESALACRDAVRRRMLAYRGEAQRKLEQALQEPRRLIDAVERRRVQPASVPPPPKVSIVLHGREWPAAPAARSLRSCLGQTHQNLEIILACAPEAEAELSGLVRQLDGSGRVRCLPLSHGSADALTAGLQAAAGEYAAWLEVGDWPAPDAVAALVAALEQNRDFEAAHACYYLTRDGMIERKVCLDTPQKPGQARRPAPFVLVRRSAAGRVRGGAWHGRAVYLQNALFFKAATDSESDLFRALAAFGRGDFDYARRLLARAAAAGRDKHWAETPDLAGLIAGIARNGSVTATPEQFVDLLFSMLPAAASMQALKRQVLAQLAMRRLFERVRESKRRETLRTLFFAVGHDRSWLANRGVWMLLLRLCLGRL
jgi:polysaccharide pyruvyl transferase WcaK-like protein